MPRKRTTITIDESALDAFKRLAKNANMSLPRYLELCMIRHAKLHGEMPDVYEPLGETRGGSRARTSAISKS